MKLLKKLLILFFKKKIIILPIILITSLIIYYLEISDLTLFNNQEIFELKKKLLDLQEDLEEELALEKNLEKDLVLEEALEKDLEEELALEKDLEEELALEKTSNNNNLYKDLIIVSCLVLFGLIIYFNSGDSSSISDNYNLANELNRLTLEEVSKKLLMPISQDKDFIDKNFVDEVDELRRLLKELAKK